MPKGTARVRRLLGAAVVLLATLLAILAIGGERLLARRLVTDGDRTRDGMAFEKAMRYVFDEKGPAEGAEAGGGRGQRGPTSGPDTRDFYYARRDEQGSWDLWRRRRGAQGLESAEPLFELNGPTSDCDPEFIEGGAFLVFASDRPGGRGGFDLYIAERRGESFGPPRNLGPTVNGPGDERHPAFDPANGLLYFSSDRMGGRSGNDDLYVTRRQIEGFARPEPVLGLELGDGASITGAALAPNGREMVLSCRVEGDGRGFDLYRSRLVEGAWTRALPIAALNSDEDEVDPAFDRGAETLLFARSRPGSAGLAFDLVTAERREIFEVEASPDGLWRQIIWLLGALIVALLCTLLYLQWGRLHPFIKFLILSLVAHLLFLLFADDLEGGSTVAGTGSARAHHVSFLASRSETESSESRSAARGEAVAVAKVEKTLESAAASGVEAARPEVDFAAQAAAPSERPADLRREAAPGAEAPRSEVAAAAIAPAASAEAAAMEAAARHDGRDPAASVQSESRSSEHRRQGGRLSAERSAAAASRAPEAAAEGRDLLAATAASRGAKLTDRASEARSESLVGSRPAPTAVSGEAAEAVAKQAANDGVRRSAPGDRTAAGETAARASGELASERPSGALTPTAAEVPASLPSAAMAAREVGKPGLSELPASAPLAARRSAPAFAGPATAAREAAPEGESREPVADRAGPTIAEARSVSTGRGPDGRTTLSERSALSKPMTGAEPLGPQTELVLRRGALEAARAGETPVAARSERQAASSPLLSGQSARDIPTAMGPAAPAVPRLPGQEARETAAVRLSTAGLDSTPPPASSLHAGLRRNEEPLPTPRDLLARREVALAEAPSSRPETYSQRSGSAKVAALETGGGSAETEAAVLAGLRYLASHQRPDGSWGRRRMHDKYGDLRIGKTGLALLAFLGSGYTQAQESEFKTVVARGLAFLLGEQDADTGHIGQAEAYGHGIASYALGEAYAMTRDGSLREPLGRAVRRIIRAQSSGQGDKRDGGWSYYYADPLRRFDAWPRASITVWQLMALKSATLGGLQVPDAIFERAREFLLASWDSDLGAFRYNHDPAWLASPYPTLPGSNSAALFGLQLLGVPDEHPSQREGFDFVLARRPRFAWRRPDDRSFVERGLGNLYFHYYAALALHRHGGEDWRAWNEELKPLLLDNQAKDGSWQPIDAYAEYADDRNDDRCYTTAMCVLMLEVYYRYFTPLLADVADARATDPDGPNAPIEIGGLRIVDVTAGRKAEAIGLKVGDEIMEMDDRRLADLSDLEKALAKVGRDDTSRLLVRRGRDLLRFEFRGRLGGLRVQGRRD